MSSHREAPEISKDPVADSTDVYAFVSPDKPDTVTLIANYIPLQGPAGGPNFYSFGDDVLYEIHIDNDGNGQDNITYAFHFQTQLRDPDTFLYNTGPILSLDSPNWNSRQFYSVTRIQHGISKTLATDLPCPPCNIGPLSTPHYATLANEAVHEIADGIKVFAGQRAEGFYVDLGSIFDLANLRPFEQLHEQYGMHVFTKPAAGVNATAQLNVHSIAIQIPTWELLRPGKHGEGDAASVIGVWTTASRQQVTVWDDWRGENVNSGPFRQVSRLGNPLFNEVLIPLGSKDLWNSLPPKDDKRFASYVAHPELAGLLPALYPACSRTWRSWSRPGPRAPTWRRSCSPASRLASSRASRTTPARCRRTCCGSTPRSSRARSRTSSASSAATWPASPTAAASSTTWSRSSCARSPGSPSRWWTRRTSPTRRPGWSPTG